MNYSVDEAKAKLTNIIQQLVEKKEDVIFITQNGEPIVQMVRYNSASNRVGAAKKEMKDFDISLEDFNNIPINNFGINN